MKARFHWRPALFAVMTTAALVCSCANAAPRSVTLTGQTSAAVAVPGERSGMIYSASFAPDGKLLASGNDKGQITLWDTATDQLKTTLSGHTAFVQALSWSPQSNMLLSAGQTFRKRGMPKAASNCRARGAM